MTRGERPPRPPPLTSPRIDLQTLWRRPRRQHPLEGEERLAVQGQSREDDGRPRTPPERSLKRRPLGPCIFLPEVEPGVQVENPHLERQSGVDVGRKSVTAQRSRAPPAHPHASGPSTGVSPAAGRSPGAPCPCCPSPG